MAGSVLTEQYVDIVARNLRETMDALRAIQRQADATGEAFKRMKAASGGGGPGGGMPGVGAIAGGIGAAVGAVAGVAAAGLGGTVEMEQMGMALTNVAKEVGNLFAPALRLATDLLNMLTNTFRGTGSAGQFLLVTMSPLSAVFEVLANSRVQESLNGLMVSFGRIVTAVQPLINLMANLGASMLDVFVITPLVEFVRVLTIVASLVAEISKRAVAMIQSFGALAGFGNLFKPMDRTRSEARLNQTGTEDADGTFQRIQQAILKASGPAEVPEQQLDELKEIRKQVDAILNKFDATAGQVQAIVSYIGAIATNPTASAQGVISSGVSSISSGLASLFNR